MLIITKYIMSTRSLTLARKVSVMLTSSSELGSPNSRETVCRFVARCWTSSFSLCPSGFKETNSERYFRLE